METLMKRTALDWIATAKVVVRLGEMVIPDNTDMMSVVIRGYDHRFVRYYVHPIFTPSRCSLYSIPSLQGWFSICVSSTSNLDVH